MPKSEIIVGCKNCGTPTGFGSRGKPRIFCRMECKAEWQRSQKPVDEKWLRSKYIDEGLSTYEIAEIVARDPKSVFNWLRGYGIPTRTREWSTIPRQDGCPYQDAGWLWCQYFFKGRSTGEIAEEFGVTPANVLFFLRRHGIPRRSTGEARAIKHWGLSGEANGMYGVRGEDHPNWQGGHTPERQAFYATIEWRVAFDAVWRRDGKKCQRCGAMYRKGAKLEVHHIAPFAVAELRSEVSNLVLLCMGCHDFVHGKSNITREFLKGIDQA